MTFKQRNNAALYSFTYGRNSASSASTADEIINSEEPQVVVQFDTGDLKNMISNILHLNRLDYEVIQKILTRKISTETINEIYNELVSSPSWNAFWELDAKTIIEEKFSYLWDDR